MQGGELIEFKFHSFDAGVLTYNAVEGMTWEEWVNSEYNVDGFYILDDGVYYAVIASWHPNIPYENFVKDVIPTDVISHTDYYHNGRF